MKLNAGDKIVANKGIAEALAVGTVSDAGYLVVSSSGRR